LAWVKKRGARSERGRNIRDLRLEDSRELRRKIKGRVSAHRESPEMDSGL